MNQHTLAPHPGARKKKVSRGRGDASGLGSFSGRGCKGQSARSGGKVKPGFEGGQTPLIRRMPKLKGFKNPNRLPFQVVNVGDLNDFNDNSEITIVTLFEQKLISKKNRPIKILGNGKLEKKLIFKVDAVSKEAQDKIEKSGGTLHLPKKVEVKSEDQNEPQKA